jgi:hypothetical protein
MQDNERIIELIAKSLDEPLDVHEQAQVNQAMQDSLAIRLASEGLREFDSLLKRTGMAIPEEGFPARVIARLEAYEKSRTRRQWLLTVGVIFLGSVAGLAWFVLNAGWIADTVLFFAANAFVLIPFTLAFVSALLQYIGQGPLLIYALLVLLITIIWARVSGGLPKPL